MRIQTCSRCKLEKPISDFHKNKSTKSGYHNNCKVCNSFFKKNYVKSNKDFIKFSNKIYREFHKEDKKIKDKIYRENNKDVIKTKRNKNKKINSEKNKIRYQISGKEKARERNRIRSKTDNLYKLKRIISRSILNSFKKTNHKKNNKTSMILGCSFEEFKLYIESKFESWMDWNNHGFYDGNINFGWDLDHIIPIASAKTEEEVIKLNHYTNFQPLCSYVNRVLKRDYHPDLATPPSTAASAVVLDINRDIL